MTCLSLSYPAVVINTSHKFMYFHFDLVLNIFYIVKCVFYLSYYLFTFNFSVYLRLDCVSCA